MINKIPGSVLLFPSLTLQRWKGGVLGCSHDARVHTAVLPLTDAKNRRKLVCSFLYSVKPAYRMARMINKTMQYKSLIHISSKIVVD